MHQRLADAILSTQLATVAHDQVHLQRALAKRFPVCDPSDCLQIQTFMSFQNSSQCSTKHVWEDLRIQTFVLVLVVNLILLDCGGGFLLFCSPHVYSARFFNQMWLSFHTGSNDSSGNENPHPLIREAKNGTGSTSSTRS